MTRTRHLIPLCLALTLGAAPLFAQTEQPAPSEPATATAGARKNTPAPQSSTDNAKQDAGANKKNRSDSGGNSPFDYRASEEISEDLPVSFPADI